MQSKQQTLQKIIQFQYSKIRTPSAPKNKDNNPETQNNNRFGIWNLEDKINRLGLTGKPFGIRWVGSGDSSYLDAFVYCLLKGFSGEKSNKGTQYNLLKNVLYQLSENSLSLQQQKQLVEILCNANYASNIPNFLNKNTLTILVSKIYKATSQANDSMHQIEKLKTFSNHFNFVNYEILGECSVLMKNLQKEFYIIEERSCIFVIQIGEFRMNVEESKAIEPAGFSAVQKGTTQGTPSFITKNSSNRKGKTEATYFSAQKQLEQKGQNIDFINENQGSQTNMTRSKTNIPISSVQTLRNTIDIHINHLQSLTIKPKKEKNRSKPAHLPSKNKELNRGRAKSIVEIIQSKSEDKNKKSLSPEKTPKIIPMNSPSLFPRNKMMSKQASPSPKNKFHPKKSNSNFRTEINQQRVSFSYQAQ